MAHKVLITGASGLLGRAVMKEFVGKTHWEVLGLAFSRVNENLRRCDITKEDEVKAILQEFKPEFIIHCAAERRPDVVEKKVEATQALNVTASKTLAQLAVSSGAVLVYMSTDYVFDGKNPPYDVDGKPNPLNKYGKSKLEGERVVLDTGSDHIVLRVPILYGQVEKLEESAVTILFRQVKDFSSPCSMCHHQQRYPTHVADVALVLRELLEKRLQDTSLRGIFHWSGVERMTKYDMTVTMAGIFGLDVEHIKPSLTAPPGAERPHDAQLDPKRIDSLGIGRRTPFRDGIKASLQNFVTT